MLKKSKTRGQTAVDSDETSHLDLHAAFANAAFVVLGALRVKVVYVVEVSWPLAGMVGLLLILSVLLQSDMMKSA